MAKRFFYVCAGVLLLALSAAVGYRQSGAQAGGPVYFAGVGGASAMVVGRTLYFMTNAQTTPTPYPEQVPGSADIAAVHVFNGAWAVPATTVVLTNGDVYVRDGYGTNWAYIGSWGAATTARPASWGFIKANAR